MCWTSQGIVGNDQSTMLRHMKGIENLTITPMGKIEQQQGKVSLSTGLLAICNIGHLSYRLTFLAVIGCVSCRSRSLAGLVHAYLVADVVESDAMAFRPASKSNIRTDLFPAQPLCVGKHLPHSHYQNLIWTLLRLSALSISPHLHCTMV
jgi:hypothetical protein